MISFKISYHSAHLVMIRYGMNFNNFHGIILQVGNNDTLSVDFEWHLRQPYIALICKIISPQDQ